MIGTRLSGCLINRLTGILSSKRNYSVTAYNLLTWSHRSLARDIKLSREREQVIKLIRTFIELSGDRLASFTPPGCGRVLVTEPIMRAVIAIAEQPEDPLRQICCETLVETRASLVFLVCAIMLTRAVDSTHRHGAHGSMWRDENTFPSISGRTHGTGPSHRHRVLVHYRRT